ncbi:MAG: ATP-binding protein [Pacificimonas sp.]|jgi:two-component system cell cycle sensor histidine kinase/response regulator CckA|nr:ATP-binding protein [Pacificimonas sp.]
MASRSPLRADQLPDPTEWPDMPGVTRGLWLIVLGVVTLAILSALLVGYALGVWEFAALFGALILASAGVSYAAALGRARREAGPVDLSMVRAALESQQVALAITDREGRLVCANAAYGARAGGMPSPLVLAPAGSRGSEALKTAEAAARRDGTGFADLDLVGDDGLTRRLRLSVKPAEQSREHLLWTLRRDRTDKAIDDLAELVSGVFGIWLGDAGYMAAITDSRGEIVASNGMFRDNAGLDADAGRPNLGRLLTLDENDDAWLLPANAASEEDRLPVHLARLPLSDEPGDSMAGAFMFLLRRRELQPLMEERAPTELPGLLGVLPIGLALADRDGQLVMMNDAFRSAAGIAHHADESLLYPSDLVENDDKSAVSALVRKAVTSEGARDMSVRLKHRPEEPVVLTVGRAPWQDGPAVVLSLKDNREQLKLERQITQATKMQAVGQLAGGVAHDFNNILTAIIGYCDLMLMRHSPGDPDFDDVNQVRQNANRAANLVRQLLAFSRQQTLRPQLLQVSDVIGELSHLLKRLLGERVTLKVEHGRGLAPVRADPGQMEQVIVNLAVNARDAMPEGGELVIRTFSVSPAEARALNREGMPPADYVAISVGDTGSGIPPEAIGKIFEPFFTTKPMGSGTGLGLSTVYGIVKQSGGFIFADSAPDQGTTMTIYLPEQEEAEMAAPAEATVPKETDFGSGRVLIAEDEDMVRAVAERALTRKGYDVTAASGGEEAYELLVAMDVPPDLLISDVVMPGMDGPALVKKARALYPELKIIFMSGYAEEQLRSSVEIDNAGFLSKPFSVAEITARVADALRSGGPA